MKRWLAVAMAALAITASAQDPKPPDTDLHRKKVVERLKDVLAALAKAESLSYEVTKTMSREGEEGSHIRSKEKVTLKKPKLGRVEKLGTPDSFRLADGKEMWVNHSKEKSYSRNGQNESTFGRFFLTDYLVSRLFFITEPETLLRKQGDLAVEKGRIEETEYRIVSWKGLSGYGSLTETRLWIDGNSLPRRVEKKWEQQGLGDPRPITETEEISNLVLNPALAPDAFRYSPAKEAEEICVIETNSRGKLPEGPEADAANKIFEGIRASLKGVEAIDYEVEIKTVGPRVDPKSQPRRRRVRAKRPGFARIDNVSPVEDKSVLVDGEWTWTIEKERKKYLRTWLLDTYLSTAPDNDPWYRLFWERKPTRLLVKGSEVKVGREKIGETECHRINWITTENYAMTAGGAPKTYEIKWSLWLDLEGTPRRVVKEWEHGDDTYVETSTYGPVDLKAKPEGGVFKFAPPADWTTPPMDAEEMLIAVGSKAPEFEAIGLDGKAVKLSDFKGKPVVLTFWMAGSGFCAEELANLARIHKEYAKRGVVILAVNFNDLPKAVHNHFKANELPFTPLMQKPYEISGAFSVRVYPTTYVIDPEGRVAARWISVEEGELRTTLDKVAVK